MHPRPEQAHAAARSHRAAAHRCAAARSPSATAASSIPRRCACITGTAAQTTAVWAQALARLLAGVLRSLHARSRRSGSRPSWPSSAAGWTPASEQRFLRRLDALVGVSDGILARSTGDRGCSMGVRRIETIYTIPAAPGAGLAGARRRGARRAHGLEGGPWCSMSASSRRARGRPTSPRPLRSWSRPCPTQSSSSSATAPSPLPEAPWLRRLGPLPNARRAGALRGGRRRRRAVDRSRLAEPRHSGGHDRRTPGRRHPGRRHAGGS